MVYSSMGGVCRVLNSKKVAIPPYFLTSLLVVPTCKALCVLFNLRYDSGDILTFGGAKSCDMQAFPRPSAKKSVYVFPFRAMSRSTREREGIGDGHDADDPLCRTSSAVGYGDEASAQDKGAEEHRGLGQGQEMEDDDDILLGARSSP